MLRLSVNHLSSPVLILALLISIGLLAHFGSLTLITYVENVVAMNLVDREQTQKMPSLPAPVAPPAQTYKQLSKLLWDRGHTWDRYMDTFERHVDRFKREKDTHRKDVPFLLADMAVYATGLAGGLITLSLPVAAIYLLFRKRWFSAIALLLAWTIPVTIGMSVPMLFELVVSTSTLRFLNLTLLLFGIIAIAVIYCLPAIVAFVRRKKDRKRLLLLNLCFGLVPLVWPILLSLSFL